MPSVSSFRGAKCRIVIAEPQQATNGISLCLCFTMPMLCLWASQLYKPKQTFSFIDSIWLIFLSLCVCMRRVLPRLPWQQQTNRCRGSESFEACSFRLFSRSQLGDLHPEMLFSTLDLVSLIQQFLSLASCPSYITKFILPSWNTQSSE